MKQTIGLDFGTSNTVAVSAQGVGATAPISFVDGNDSFTSLPTVLSFLDRGPAKALNAEVGPWAIRQFLESFGDVNGDFKISK